MHSARNTLYAPATLTFRSFFSSSCKSSADFGANVVGDIDIVQNVISRQFLCYLKCFVWCTISTEPARWKGEDREKSIPIDANGADGQAGV